jgi:hypothetical protein
MDASQLRYPETVYSGSEHKFCIMVPPNSAFRLGRKVYIFYLLKVCEMLWNTPKHQFGSNEVEWKLHNFGTPKQCIQSRNTSFAFFYLSKVSEMLWNTTKNYYGSNRVERMLHNFSTPKQCIQSRNIIFASFYLSKVSEILRNTPKHHFGSNGDVSHICYPEVVHSCSDARSASFTCRRLTKCFETHPNIILDPME